LAYFGYDTLNGDPFSAKEAAFEFKKQFLAIKKDFVLFCKGYNRKVATPIDLKCGIEMASS